MTALAPSRQYTVLAGADAEPGHVARTGAPLAEEIDFEQVYTVIDRAGPGVYTVVDSLTRLTFWIADRRPT